MDDYNRLGIFDMPFPEPEEVCEPRFALIRHAVSAMLDHCGNSYVNAYTENWLTLARDIGAYRGPVTGKIKDVKDEWNVWLDQNGGLPELMV